MDYDAIAAVFLVPGKDPIEEPHVPTSSARRLRDALEAIATQGWWPRPVYDRMTALGLGFFDGYVWGRAASLGEPSAPVVAAAFGVFEPTFVGAVYEQGRSVASRADVLAAREGGAVASLEAVLAGRTDEAVDVADRLLAATAGLDATARPLFAGLRALDLPVSPFGRLWRAAELVREHRGDGHLAACIVAGLDPCAMSVLTELWLGYPVGEYSATRGYDPDAVAAAVAALEARGWFREGALSAEGRAARDAIETATDRSQDALLDALGADLEDTIRSAGALSAAVVAAGAAPADPRKRAAG